MPEIQKSPQLGEMTQRFIEFVMMQAQQAAMFLGRIPNPQTGEPEVNLEVARMFIDQLEMIHEKTRGNLNKEEGEILSRVLADLHLAFVQAAGGPAAPSSQPPAVAEASAPVAAPVEEAAKLAPAPEEESRKKFTKSYGA